jgi:hypothetical protein
MNEELALFMAFFTIFTLLLIIFADYYCIPAQRKLAKAAINEVVDQILNYNPAIPETDWDKVISKKFDLIFNHLHAVHEDVALELFENRSMPMAIGFFALYHKVNADPLIYIQLIPTQGGK